MVNGGKTLLKFWHISFVIEIILSSTFSLIFELYMKLTHYHVAITGPRTGLQTIYDEFLIVYNKF